MGPGLTEVRVEEIGGVRLFRAYSQDVSFATCRAWIHRKEVQPKSTECPACLLLTITGAWRDAERETACGCTVHLKIVHVLAGEEFFDNRPELAVRNVLLREQVPELFLFAVSETAVVTSCSYR